MTQKRAAAPAARSGETRARILDAAQDVFAAKGYVHGSVRDIAARANVAASLVLKYFGTKETLFERAFRASLDLTPMLSLPRSDYGAGVMRLLNGGNSDAVRSSAMLALSIADPRSRAIVIRLMEEDFVAPVANWMGGRQQVARAELVAMLTLGFSALRILLPLEKDGDARNRFVTDCLAEMLQRIADMPDGRSDAAPAQ